MWVGGYVSEWAIGLGLGPFDSFDHLTQLECFAMLNVIGCELSENHAIILSGKHWRYLSWGQMVNCLNDLQWMALYCRAIILLWMALSCRAFPNQFRVENGSSPQPTPPGSCVTDKQEWRHGIPVWEMVRRHTTTPIRDPAPFLHLCSRGKTIYGADLLGPIQNNLH